MPDIIEKNPKVLGGQPVIKGTRVPVARIMGLIALDYSLKDLKKKFLTWINLQKKISSLFLISINTK